MGSRSITGVLGLLRKLKKTEGLGLNHTALNFLQQWSNEPSPSVVLRMSVGIIEQVDDARNQLAGSELTDEAKEGLLATLGGLSGAFSLGGMNSPIQNYIPALDSAITNFAIVSSMAAAAFPDEAKQEIADIVSGIIELRDSAEISALGQPLRDTIVRQLNALVALLHNAEAAGVDAAVAAYLELLLQMRRAQASENNGAAEKSGIWQKISSWGDRLIKVSDMVDAGNKLGPLIERAPDLLKLIG